MTFPSCEKQMRKHSRCSAALQWNRTYRRACSIVGVTPCPFVFCIKAITAGGDPGCGVRVPYVPNLSFSPCVA
ncbi:uncharacterized [Tachysurus ichikawai]